MVSYRHNIRVMYSVVRLSDKAKASVPIKLLSYSWLSGRELGTLVSRRGDSTAVNTEAQILLRIIYRQDCGEYASGAVARLGHSIRSGCCARLLARFLPLGIDIEYAPISCPNVLK